MPNAIKQKLIAAFIALGLSAPAAFVAYDLTLPSEGLILSPYSDPVGLTTYCAGHLALKHEKLKSSYTIEECMDLFAKDWKKHEKETDQMVGGKDKFASAWQRTAATDMTFNNGAGLIGPSTMISLIKQGKHRAACEQLIRWNKGRVKGVLVVLKGLVTRRENTMPYCLGELSYDKQKAYEAFEVEYEKARKELEATP